MKKNYYKCPYCDTEVPLDTINCPNCGAIITPVEEPETPKQVNPETPKRKSIFKRWWFWVILGACFIIIFSASIGGITYGIVSSNHFNNTVEVNEWAKINDFQIRVVNVEKKDNKVCLLVEIKNDSDSFKLISDSKFTLKSEKNSYDVSREASQAYANSKGDYRAFDILENLDAGSSAKYYIVFETENSSSSDEFKLQYKDGLKIINVKL